jgi:hypothetical protein
MIPDSTAYDPEPPVEGGFGVEPWDPVRRVIVV